MRVAALARQLSSKPLSGQLARLLAGMTRRWPADARSRRISEMAASGDELGTYLAGEFSRPEQLLGGESDD